MRVSKISLVIILVMPLISGLCACSSMLIGERNGTNRVSLANANQIGSCQPKGETIVSVIAKVGFIHRTTDAVEADLYQLARNNAVDAGADTLVKGKSKEFGTRTYAMYKCRP